MEDISGVYPEQRNGTTIILKMSVNKNERVKLLCDTKK